MTNPKMFLMFCQNFLRRSKFYCGTLDFIDNLFSSARQKKNTCNPVRLVSVTPVLLLVIAAPS